MDKNYKKKSKFLSLILRHEPEKIGLELDKNGWAKVDELIQKAAEHRVELSHQLIGLIVRDNDKQRFALSEDGSKIRANQGHSIKVDVELKKVQPPETLYHGTATRHLDAIFAEGLKPRSRLHVHLSSDLETAKKVGMRHEKIVVLEIPARQIAETGQDFFLSENGVWLTSHIDKEYLNFLEE